ncbi:MAG: FtsQ-type POTRA domain-containing protein [Thermodesulfobacteriota bacterium]
MRETVTIQQEKFFRPKKKREEKGEEKFQGMLKKVLRVAFQLLLYSSILFFGHRVYVYLLENSFFQVREVKIEGCRKIAPETLLSLIRIEGMPNLFTVSLSKVARRLESHPWIERVRARKVFPSKILIQVEERKPIAILQLEDLYYIDTKGVIFSSVGDRDEYNYPFLTGLTRQVLEKDPEEAKRLITKALELLRIVEKEKVPPLEEISEIQMEKIFGIHCFTRAEGVEVRMGWEHFGEKLKRLSLIWSDLQKRGFSAASIDCSDLKRMVVKKIPRGGENGRR